MAESREMKCMRQQAWERAKGELRSILVTYYGHDQYEKISDLIENFTKTIDNEGLVD